MNRYGKAGKLLAYTVGAVTGFGSGPEGVFQKGRSLSGIKPDRAADTPFLDGPVRLLTEVAEGRYVYSDRPIQAAQDQLEEFFRRGVGTFLRYYSRPEQADQVDSVLGLFESGVDPELLAEEISRVWMPELALDDDSILSIWRLSELTPNPDPIRPEEVLLQLNALYTYPDGNPEECTSRLPEELKEQVEQVCRDPGRKVADYDHPVHLYDPDEKHELISCLQELDGEIAFEKEQGVLPPEHTVPVLLSVSVTHEGLDQPAGDWIRWLLQSKHYHHLRVIVLTENMVGKIKAELAPDHAGEDPFPIYSVFGKYGRHFNALKYSQLLFEKVLGVRAGFKLDTDEGIRSRDLYAARGKTWFQVLCHPYWGGSAVDWRGSEVLLGVNEGEYVNSTDIDKFGFPAALRIPDVSIPNSWSGPNMFFQKGFAHGRTTALYNKFETVEAAVSHTVVKGGGYGITNEGLRKAVPFTFSWVGRAEDQQFYFSGIPGGLRGIFHPDLRIAHYKASVKGAEQKTAATRFIGDMYRLIIFKRLAELMGVKKDIDPMPGVFAGELAPAQAVFATLLKAVEFNGRNNVSAAKYLLKEGTAELLDLEHRIERKEVDREVRREREMWRYFIERSEKVRIERIREICDLP